MASLAQERCFTHPAREAACRCPECRRFFCRECTTEHEGRLLCSACLGRLSVVAAKPRKIGVARQLALGLSALVLAWLFFYGAGQLLIQLAGPYYVEGSH